MKALNFLSWWWNQYPRGDKQLIILTLFMLTVPLVAWMLSFGFLAIVLITVSTFFVVLLGLVIHGAVSDRWKQYTKVKEQEAERIMQNLKYGKS
jgi:Ca2+/Na+ antiporter